MSDIKRTYRVKLGYRHGKNKEHGPGDIVEMTEFEAFGFLDKLELVEESKPVKSTRSTAKKAAAKQTD